MRHSRLRRVWHAACSIPAPRLGGGKPITTDLIDGSRLADNGNAGSDEKKGTENLHDHRTTLPEHGLAQVRSLTSRSRMRPITFRCSAAVYFGIQGEIDLRTNPINTNSGSSSIELTSCPPAPGDRSNAPAHRDLRHALAAERVRIRHMCKALACTEDGNLRQRWQMEMADSLARVREIEQTLRAGSSPAEQRVADMVDECLLEAMELARANGDSRAAETVAMECMALVEMRCMRIQQGSIGQEAAFVPGNEGIHYKEQNHEKYQ